MSDENAAPKRHATLKVDPVDALRREIEHLRELVEALTERVGTLEDEVARLYREK